VHQLDLLIFVLFLLTIVYFIILTRNALRLTNRIIYVETINVFRFLDALKKKNLFEFSHGEMFRDYRSQSIINVNNSDVRFSEIITRGHYDKI